MPSLRWPVVLAAAFAMLLAGLSLPVAALGLGQLQVLSRSGEPLLAEIPVVTSDPRELENLQARLASPETFRRIGLEPPVGDAANLRFAVALDARGNPVVRVTSAAPIDQPLLTFLLEVDWGQGRLVREYSVLVDAPQSAAAAGQPPIEAPLPAPPATVVRPVEAPLVQREALPDEAPAGVPPAESPLPDIAPEPEPEPAPVSAVPAAPQPQPQPEFQPPPTAPPSDYGPVQRGQTLSEIVASQALGGVTLNQAMLAVLRANPDAFIDGNINLLREGAVLRVPGRDMLAELSPAEANAVVRAQVRTWRERSAPPVVATEAVAGPAAGRAAAAPSGADDDEGAAGARLQIVPPAGDGQAPGSRSGTSAGGEGDMVRSELQQARETLAARDAEVEELRTRLAEVEELQRKQAELLDLKDSELATVQQRLAANRTGADTTATAEPPAAPVLSPGSPWLLGGLLLLVAAALAWGWQRRRGAAAMPPPAPKAPPRRNYDTDAMAASLKAPRGAASAAPATQAAADPVAPATAVPPPPASRPTWHDPAVAPTGTPASGDAAPSGDDGATSQVAGRDSLELARAYLDMGDHQAARTLLREVLLGPDPEVREEAARLLRGLG